MCIYITPVGWLFILYHFIIIQLTGSLKLIESVPVPSLAKTGDSSQISVTR